MAELRPRHTVATRPDFTPHVRVDLEGATAGDAIDINGHLFLAHDARFNTYGEILQTPHGAASVTQRIASLELKLVHADWAGCPIIDPAPQVAPDPSRAGAWSVWSVQPGNRLFLFHAPTSRFLPVVVDMAEAWDAETMAAQGGRLVSDG